MGTGSSCAHVLTDRISPAATIRESRRIKVIKLLERNTKAVTECHKATCHLGVSEWILIDFAAARASSDSDNGSNS